MTCRSTSGSTTSRSSTRHLRVWVPVEAGAEEQPGAAGSTSTARRSRGWRQHLTNPTGLLNRADGSPIRSDVPQSQTGFTRTQVWNAAAASTHVFAAVGDITIRKQEVAAFLANVALRNTQPQVCVDKSGAARAPITTLRTSRVPLRRWFGRTITFAGGPLQISWNYNYGVAGAALGANPCSPTRASSRPTRPSRGRPRSWLLDGLRRRKVAYRPHHDGSGRRFRADRSQVIINGAVECNGRKSLTP